MVVAVYIGVALLSSMAGLWLAFDACKRRRIDRQLAAVCRRRPLAPSNFRCAVRRSGKVAILPSLDQL